MTQENFKFKASESIANQANKSIPPINYDEIYEEVAFRIEETLNNFINQKVN